MVTEDKQFWREHIWDRMVAEKVVGFPGAHGRIPNFVGAGEAARLLAELPEWVAAAPCALALRAGGSRWRGT